MLQLDEALWREVSPLLDRALECEPEERGALIDSVRASRPDAAAALERLLRAQPGMTASGFLETPPGAPAAPSLAGQTLGPYTLVDLLGSGGMGTVWRARRSDGRFEGDVAVKLLNLAMLDRAGEERFRREGTFLSRLSHPSIARILDAGVSPSGQPFLVLELVDGSLLDEYADGARLGVRARLELFTQVADAVAHAHSNLVVHRDLKPSNILVDRQGRVKLLDFGIATLLDDGSGQPVARTVPTSRALTPAYAAPEQVLGQPVTTATDVYALGVLLYELLSGTHPTARHDATPVAAVWALAEREPARMSEAVAALPPGAPETTRLLAERGTTRERLERAVRGDLDTILAKALKKLPSERYATAAAFADDVRRHLLDQPVRARPDSAWYRSRKFVARHRLEVGAAAAVLLALVAGTFLAVAQAKRSAGERDRALGDLRRAEITNDFSGFLLSEATPAGKPVTKADLLARGEEMIDRRFAGDPSLRVHMLLTLSEHYYENSQFDAWRRSVERAFALSRALTDVRQRALAGCAMAIAHAEAGDHEDASKLFAGAFAELAREPESTAEEARCRVFESGAAYMAGDPTRAMRAGERALALEKERRGPPGREREALAALANAYAAGGRFAAADRTYRELMAVVEAQGLERTDAAANYLNSWAVSLQAAGQHARAVGLAERAVALNRALDADKGAPPNGLSTLASAQSYVGSHEAAMEAIREAVAKAREADSPIALFWTLGTASRVYLDGGKRQAADESLGELQAIVRRQPSLPIQIHAAMERFGARAALRGGDPGGAAAAVTLARSALGRLDTAKRPPREVLPVVLVLASALNATGDFDAAKTNAERALAMARERLGEFPHSYDVGAASLELAVAQAGLKRTAEARASCAAAVENLRESSGEGAPETRRALAIASQLRP